MKILAVSDIYGNEYVVDELCQKFNNSKIDIVVVAGGISYIGENNSHYILEQLSGIASIVLFVPGGTDNKDIKIENNKLINLDNNYFIYKDKGRKLGFFGLGGVPNRSLKRFDEFPYRWNEMLYREKLKRNLEINYQKLRLESPNFIILITHSPPYHIADYSKKIRLSDFQMDIIEASGEESQKKKYSNPVLLGSHILKEFIKTNKVDLHLFGHVHKEGGKIAENKSGTKFVNISHLSPIPYKLTGRKACIIEISNDISINFKNIVNKNLEFKDFLDTYL